ncbi:hypothetical protein GTQ40_06710 [Flavobacteriaceae bacterium R38]|nr:hypothetical protein [Flavobacteriaceae bacterium R38]
MKVVQSGKYEVKENYDEIEWDRAIKVLMAYAYSLLGNKQFTNRREQLAYDFALESITKYLENKEKFDPKRNPDLINYLKYYILRQLISNFKESAGVRKRIILKAPKNDENESNEFSIDGLIKKDDLIEENIDLQIFEDRINKKLNKKKELKEIFDLLYYKDLKRSEICKQLEIPLKEFDNRSRRMKRLLDTEMKLLLKNKK